MVWKIIVLISNVMEESIKLCFNNNTMLGWCRSHGPVEMAHTCLPPFANDFASFFLAKFYQNLLDLNNIDLKHRKSELTILELCISVIYKTI